MDLKSKPPLPIPQRTCPICLDPVGETRVDPVTRGLSQDFLRFLESLDLLQNRSLPLYLDCGHLFHAVCLFRGNKILIPRPASPKDAVPLIQTLKCPLCKSQKTVMGSVSVPVAPSRAQELVWCFSHFWELGHEESGSLGWSTPGSPETVLLLPTLERVQVPKSRVFPLKDLESKGILNRLELLLDKVPLGVCPYSLDTLVELSRSCGYFRHLFPFLEARKKYCDLFRDSEPLLKKIMFRYFRNTNIDVDLFWETKLLPRLDLGRLDGSMVTTTSSVRLSYALLETGMKVTGWPLALVYCIFVFPQVTGKPWHPVLHSRMQSLLGTLESVSLSGHLFGLESAREAQRLETQVRKWIRKDASGKAYLKAPDQDQDANRWLFLEDSSWSSILSAMHGCSRYHRFLDQWRENVSPRPYLTFPTKTGLRVRET